MAVMTLRGVPSTERNTSSCNYAEQVRNKRCEEQQPQGTVDYVAICKMEPVLYFMLKDTQFEPTGVGSLVQVKCKHTKK